MVYCSATLSQSGTARQLVGIDVVFGGDSWSEDPNPSVERSRHGRRELKKALRHDRHGVAVSPAVDTQVLVELLPLRLRPPKQCCVEVSPLCLDAVLHLLSPHCLRLMMMACQSSEC